MITKHAFESDNAAGITLSRTVNHPHSTAPNLFENLVITEPPVAVADIILRQRCIEIVHLRFFPAKSALQQAMYTQSASHPRDRAAAATRCIIHRAFGWIGYVAKIHPTHDMLVARAAHK